MGSNQFGSLFQITTWGESHGPEIGVVIDGCPPNIPISADEINQELLRRQGGKNAYTTPRKEEEIARIQSGVFEGKTTGAPISIIVKNQNVDSSKYEPIKDLLRPGHANYTYLAKYGIFDYRGGGRSSARETAMRVAAGVLAKKVCRGMRFTAYMHSIAGISIETQDFNHLKKSDIFCPDPIAEEKMKKAISDAKEAGDSVGGIIECVVSNVPIGLGDPVYQKIEARLAQGMLSIPATKGFEMGDGFAASSMKGSNHNDSFTLDAAGKTVLATNHAGGTLGGITTGDPLTFRIAFKPTSSIMLPQETVTLSGEKAEFKLPEGSRHDPCVAIRAVPIVEAMAALALADAYLLQKAIV